MPLFRVPYTRCALAVLLVISLASSWAVAADGSATDNAKPSAWVGPPTAPKATPCRFGMTRLTTWAAKGEKTKSTCRSMGLGYPVDHCMLGKHCESYSNAALLGSEIWGYTWSDDDLMCRGDECSSVDSVGYSNETVLYTLKPSAGCNATISGRLTQQFLWRIVGRGNIEVQVAGVMYCQPADLSFPCPSIGGGKAAYVGSRATCAPKNDSGTITIGKAPLAVSIPLSTLDSPTLPVDEEVVGYVGANIAKAIPLGLVGESVTFRGYCKVRSYADEPLLGLADVQGWVRDSDPGLTLTLTCQGKPHCKLATTSTCKRPAATK